MAGNTYFDSHVTESTEGRHNRKQVVSGIVFVGSMVVATICNMGGYPGIAFGFGMVSLVGLVTFVGGLRKDE